MKFCGNTHHLMSYQGNSYAAANLKMRHCPSFVYLECLSAGWTGVALKPKRALNSSIPAGDAGEGGTDRGGASGKEQARKRDRALDPAEVSV